MWKTFSFRNQILILGLLCFLNLFINNQYIQPDIMEARNLITAREMAEKGNWLLPTMNNYPRLAKPPLPTWINGAIAEFVPVSNLMIHRIPSALAGVLFIFAIFLIARILHPDSMYAFIAACIGTTAFYLPLMARQASWDIYTHAFMAIAVYFYMKAWLNNEKIYKYHLLAGVFAGLSFLSKGPVSLYAMFLPFLISWLIWKNPRIILQQGRPFILSIVTLIAVGFSWPVYVALHLPDTLVTAVTKEVGAWSDRHVRPFYQYWGFFGHIGIWSLFTLATFVYTQIKKKLPSQNYHFLLGWTFLTVILLSIPAEKKERYLLPVLLPMVLLTAQYIHFLWRSGVNATFDRMLVKTNMILMVILSIGIPIFLHSQDAGPGWPVWLLYTILLGIFIYSLIKNRLDFLLTGMVLLMTSISLVVIPEIDKLMYKNKAYTSLSTLRSKEVYEKKFYGKDINPKQIWDLGKAVDTLRMDDSVFVTPKEDGFVLLVRDHIYPKDFTTPIELNLVDSVYYDRENDDRVFYVYVGLRQITFRGRLQDTVALTK